MSFNRYMVECESIYHMSIFSDDKVLIDTWWNVNTTLSILKTEKLSVLIDTWWNVNDSDTTYNAVAGMVLIDTWWNVNRFLHTHKISCDRFNRYMVECE